MILSRRDLVTLGGSGVAAALLPQRLGAQVPAAAGSPAEADALLRLVDPELRGPFLANRTVVNALSLPQVRERMAAHIPPWLARPPIVRRAITGPKGAPDVAIAIINAGTAGAPRPALLHLHGGGYVAGGVAGELAMAHPRDQVKENGFLFPGLITCGHCGGMLVGDIKKQKYIYYRCSRYKGNCKEPYVRQEKLLEQFVAIVARVSMTPQMHQWLGRALKENSDLIETEHARVLDRLRRDQDDIRERMKQAYLDHVDGKLDDSLFARISKDYREDLKGLSREFDRLSDADHAYIDDGIALLGIAKDARRMFAEADFAGKRNILHHLLSNCSYKDGEVSATFRKPFDIIVESLPRAEAREDAKSAKIGKSKKWLPG